MNKMSNVCQILTLQEKGGKLVTKTWTDTTIAGIVPQNKRFTKQIDTNLFLYIEPSGTKVWRVRYTPGAGQNQRMKKIGIFAPEKPGHLTLIAAKEQAALINGAARSGKAIEQVTTTFQQIAEQWLEDYTGSHRNSSVRATEYRYKNYIETAPLYGKKICDVTKLEIREELRKLRSKPQTARKVHSIYNMIFRYAIGSGYLDAVNPVPEFKFVFDRPMRETPRAAVTDDPDRFGEIVMRIRTQWESGDNGAGLLLFLAYCFTRPGEARLLQWHNVSYKDNVIKLSAEQTKTASQLIIPMSRQVAEILERQKKRRVTPIQPNDYIFFAPQRGPKYAMSDALPTVKLTQLGIPRDEQSAHGFRSCASTYLREYLNADDNLVEMQLNHVIGSEVARIYNKSTKLRQRQEIMQNWANWVDKQSNEALARLKCDDRFVCEKVA